MCRCKSWQERLAHRTVSGLYLKFLADKTSYFNDERELWSNGHRIKSRCCSMLMYNVRAENQEAAGLGQIRLYLVIYIWIKEAIAPIQWSFMSLERTAGQPICIICWFSVSSSLLSHLSMKANALLWRRTFITNTNFQCLSWSTVLGVCCSMNRLAIQMDRVLLSSFAMQALCWPAMTTEKHPILMTALANGACVTKIRR